MPVDQSLVGREFPPTAPLEVTAERVAAFAASLGAPFDPSAGDAAVPPTYPIVLAFDAMQAFLASEQVDLFRIVHGEQRFAYERPVRLGDVLAATLTVVSLRQIGGADIIGTRSEIVDANGDHVVTAHAVLVHSAESA
jgi:acyl dehydratase